MASQTPPHPLLDRGVEAYAQRPELQDHLGTQALEGLCRQPNRECIVDYSAQRKALDAKTVAALAITLSQHFRARIEERRVGLVLPPGLLGVLANLALSLAGKIPVNLNPTLGRSALENCLGQAEVQTVITAAPVKQKIDEMAPGFPWPEQLLDVLKAIQQLPKLKVLGWCWAIRLLPPKALCALAKAPKQGGSEEAALLFSSGSDGAPKGVVLTHQNLLANAIQVSDAGVLPKKSSLMANLPFFHSFGFTVNLWYPLLKGIKVTFTPTPLDYKGTAKAIQQEAANILFGTSTFFRPYLTRVEPEALSSLKLVIAGAEKTPQGFHEAWEERFPNSRYLEGYGLTETAPVVSVNLPQTQLPGDRPSSKGIRPGSVGQLLPGMAAQIVDPETGEALPFGETGILKLKGPNIFTAYLNDPQRTKAVLKDGWFTTGDLVRIDPEGFLFIEGRLSRFSKIAGEMIPHGTIETAISRAYGLDTSEVPLLSISARPDETKGELLVLITTQAIELQELRQRLSAQGLPNLWIPRAIKQVPTIPILASGKLDLKALKKIAAR